MPDFAHGKSVLFFVIFRVFGHAHSDSKARRRTKGNAYADIVAKHCPDEQPEAHSEAQTLHTVIEALPFAFLFVNRTADTEYHRQ